jgi:hypothetical protein
MVTVVHAVCMELESEDTVNSVSLYRRLLADVRENMGSVAKEVTVPGMEKNNLAK